ncbi:YDG/SRA domain-containing protein [Streptomyces endophytica]|uniref:HNH endonuclease n=1 Tax=Streptomyces endophytica TaxID=2991496 RepID=A0ABY6PA73_9ACTN|nr:YDG/SRA domain-containing protein [Streptomyces endophytica]UZJ30691.1 HNH endonuclease [Streptomyces endophytica]
MAKKNAANPVKFGTPPGVVEGQHFTSHAELHAKGVHRQSGLGISGTAHQGVDSIVLSGGYLDDEYGESEITYTGEGGRDRATQRMVADQTMDSRGNAGLLLNQALGNPVRVIRGLDIKRQKATGGYEYCGLFRVAESWTTVGKEGFRICQFRLLKLAPGESPKPQPVAPDGEQTTDLEEQFRRTVAYERRIRDSAVVRAVKRMYDHTCQACGLRLVVSPEGEAISEAAHIQALGKPHNGPDTVENVLCLCPNCHALFDRGALQLTDAYEVIDGLTQKFVRALTRVKEHQIRIDCIRQHRSRWADRPYGG